MSTGARQAVMYCTPSRYTVSGDSPYMQCRSVGRREMPFVKYFVLALVHGLASVQVAGQPNGCKAALGAQGAVGRRAKALPLTLAGLIDLSVHIATSSSLR